MYTYIYYEYLEQQQQLPQPKEDQTNDKQKIKLDTFQFLNKKKERDDHQDPIPNVVSNEKVQSIITPTTNEKEEAIKDEDINNISTQDKSKEEQTATTNNNTTNIQTEEKIHIHLPTLIPKTNDSLNKSNNNSNNETDNNKPSDKQQTQADTQNENKKEITSVNGDDAKNEQTPTQVNNDTSNSPIQTNSLGMPLIHIPGAKKVTQKRMTMAEITECIQDFNKELQELENYFKNEYSLEFVDESYEDVLPLEFKIQKMDELFETKEIKAILDKNKDQWKLVTKKDNP